MTVILIVILPEQPCPLGYRSANNFLGSSNSECRKCLDPLELYDYLFLVFIFIGQLTFEFYIIDKSMKRSVLTFETIVLYISSAVEITLSAAAAFFIYAADYPSYRIRICRSHNVYDWYTLFEDPVYLRGKQFIRCGREIVYPLFSLPFLYLFLSFVCLLLIRSAVICKFKIVNGSLSIYLTMYLIPIIAFVHFVFAGLICEHSMSFQRLLKAFSVASSQNTPKLPKMIHQTNLFFSPSTLRLLLSVHPANRLGNLNRHSLRHQTGSETVESTQRDAHQSQEHLRDSALLRSKLHCPGCSDRQA